MRIAVPTKHVHRLLNHGPTTLITTAHGGRRNVMAAAWVMPIDFEPPKFAAVIAADTFTRELLLASGECVLHAPTAAMVDLTYALGSSSGRDGGPGSTWSWWCAAGWITRAPHHTVWARLFWCSIWPRTSPSAIFCSRNSSMASRKA